MNQEYDALFKIVREEIPSCWFILDKKIANRISMINSIDPFERKDFTTNYSIINRKYSKSEDINSLSLSIVDYGKLEIENKLDKKIINDWCEQIKSNFKEKLKVFIFTSSNVQFNFFAKEFTEFILQREQELLSDKYWVFAPDEVEFLRLWHTESIQLLNFFYSHLNSFHTNEFGNSNLEKSQKPNRVLRKDLDNVILDMNSFLEMERKLEKFDYIDSNHDSWLKTIRSFTKFYTHLENSTLIHRRFSTNTKGIILLGKLYGLSYSDSFKKSKRKYTKFEIEKEFPFLFD